MVWGRVPMILSEKVVEQSVDRADRGRFVKQLVLVDGSVPLAMVRKRAATRHGDPGGTRGTVLLIHGYGQNRYAWHLPSRSVTNFLARLGYDVFNLDLRGHGRSAHLGASRPVGPDDYVREDVPTALEEILHLTAGRPVFLLGHSLGGLVSYAVAPRAEGAVAGVASIGSPYHFCRGARSLAAVGEALAFLESRAELLEGDVAMELRLVGELVRSFRTFVDSPLYPLPVRGYSPDNIETDVLSQHMSLAMDMGSIRVMRLMFRWARERESRRDVPGGVEGFGEAFEAMTHLPLLVIAGSKDDLAPPPGVKSAYDRSLAVDKTYRSVPAGHIDLLVGRNAPRTTWPILEAWLGRRLGARAAAQQPGPTQPAPTQPQAEQAETPPGSAE
jgi:polyhydroxyalkanoate synthase subunit PhaC